MGWHKRGISGMGPNCKLGLPKITHAKDEVCECVCVSSIRTLICSRRDSPLVFQQLQHETRVLEGKILNPPSYTHTYTGG